MEYIISLLQSGVSTIVPFVLLLGILIFVHELGHFSVAKYFGVRVEVFSLGFGKKIFQVKRGDTVYCLSLFPLGGYVKMYGDEPGVQLDEEQKKYSFNHKPVSQRIAVVLAGPLMNLFFAVFLYFILSYIGEPVKAPIVGDVEIGSVAQTKGFRSGDLVQQVNSTKIESWDQFQSVIGESHDQEVTIQVKGEDSIVRTISATPVLAPSSNVLRLRSKAGDIPGLSNQAEAPIVGIKKGSLADQAGMKSGDLIVKVGEVSVKYFRDLQNTIFKNSGQNLTFSVKRPIGAKMNKFEDLQITFAVPAEADWLSLGIESGELYLAHIVPDSPAAKSGLAVGDKVTKVGDQQTQSWKDLLNYVKNFDEKQPLRFEIVRGNETLNFEINPLVTSLMNSQGGEEKRFTIGVAPFIQWAAPEIIELKNYNPAAAFSRAVERTWDITSMTVVSFLRLIQGVISPKNIGGVISIGQVASESFNMGIGYFIGMMAILSINLFILNLLPIPVLDGGHLVFYTLEAIKGAPVSLRKMEIAQQVGLAMLLSLMVFALFNDFTRIFSS